MAGPKIGEVFDGYRFRGGNPNDQASWEKLGVFDASGDTKKYAEKLATQRATSDMKRLDDSFAAERDAYSNEDTANMAAELIPRTKTGAFAEQRRDLGRAIGSPLTNALSLGFVPTKEQTADIESVERLGNMGALGQVGQLKGPLSDKDILFIKSLQYGINQSPEQNRRVVEAQKWLSQRQAAYAAGLRKWTENLGSPSAVNNDGMSFDRWWGEYSAKKLPVPGTRSAPAKAQPGKKSGYTIISVD